MGDRVAQTEFAASNRGCTNEGHWRIFRTHEIGRLSSRGDSRFSLAFGLLLLGDCLPTENMRVRPLT